MYSYQLYSCEAWFAILHTDGDDYVAMDIELTFNFGDSELCKNITINDDSLLEPEENFFVVLTSITGEGLFAPVAQVTIQDNEEGK